MTPFNDSPDPRRRQTWITLLFAVVLLTPALVGFGMKFIELLSLSRGESEGWFAVSPVVNYLLASVGFLCLFGWAAAHGMFHNMEEPKRQMLVNEAILDGSDADLVAQSVNGSVQSRFYEQVQLPKSVEVM